MCEAASSKGGRAGRQRRDERKKGGSEEKSLSLFPPGIQPKPFSTKGRRKHRQECPRRRAQREGGREGCLEMKGRRKGAKNTVSLSSLPASNPGSSTKRRRNHSGQACTLSFPSSQAEKRRLGPWKRRKHTLGRAGESLFLPSKPKPPAWSIKILKKTLFLQVRLGRSFLTQ